MNSKAEVTLEEVFGFEVGRGGGGGVGWWAQTKSLDLLMAQQSIMLKIIPKICRSGRENPHHVIMQQKNSTVIIHYFKKKKRKIPDTQPFGSRIKTFSI